MILEATDTFNETKLELIGDAIADLTGDIDCTPTGAQVAHASRALQRLVKSLDAEGQFLWRYARRTLALVAGTATYNLGADVLDLDDPCMFGKAGATAKSVVQAMSRDDYTTITDRTVRGTPSQYYFTYTLSAVPTVTLWPTPDTTGDSLEYVACLRAKDVYNGISNCDFPTKWLDCLKWGLAASLCFAYSQGSQLPMLKGLFEQEKKKLLSDDTERGNVILVPGYTGGGVL